MLAAAGLLAAFTHYFGFLLAVAVFSTCFLLAARRFKPIVGLVGSSIAVPFIAWAIFHAQFTDPRLVAWIGEFPISATIYWFVFLAFGGTASFMLFAGTAGLLFASGGRRCLAEWASSVWTCLLVTKLQPNLENPNSGASAAVSNLENPNSDIPATPPVPKKLEERVEKSGRKARGRKPGLASLANNRSRSRSVACATRSSIRSPR